MKAIPNLAIPELGSRERAVQGIHPVHQACFDQLIRGDRAAELFESVERSGKETDHDHR